MESEGDEEGQQQTSRSCPTAFCSLFYRCIKAAAKRVASYFFSYRYLLFALLGGQILSLLLCGTGVTSQALENFYSIAVPTTQLFLAYLVLALLFFPVLVVRKDFGTMLKDNWWRYLILGVIDVEANFLVVLAYKYTTLTSIQLLDSFTIVMVLILSFIFLRVRYLIIHLMGVAMCMVGIISLVLADLASSREKSGSDPILGDFLCLCGAVLYAISNVAQEYLVKNHSILEWLGFIGIVGSFVSGLQLCIYDRYALASVDWSGISVATLIVFVICLVLFYIAMPFVMKFSSAAVVNLSLLTADIFTLIFGIFLFKFRFSLLYILSFVIVLVGVFIFNLKPTPVAEPKERIKKIQNRFRQMKVFNSRKKSDTEDTVVNNNGPSNRNPGEKLGILVRGPNEAALSSRSYSTYYSESMSYSYGSHSKEGPDLLKQFRNTNGNQSKN